MLSAANNTPWTGVLIIALIIALHLFRSLNPINELFLIFFVGLLGGILDSFFVFFEWISYTSGHIDENLTAY